MPDFEWIGTGQSRWFGTQSPPSLRLKFWMVVGKGAPTARHDSEHKAKAEAERLARLHPGQEFHVLESVSRCVAIQHIHFEAHPTNIVASGF